MGEIAYNADKSVAFNGCTPGLAQGIVLSLATFLPVMATVSLSAAIPRFFEQFGAVPHRDLLIPKLFKDTSKVSFRSIERQVSNIEFHGAIR